MGCNCNKKTGNWFNLEWVTDKAQKVANIKQSAQIVYKNIEGYSFIDADLYHGTAEIKRLDPVE